MSKPVEIDRVLFLMPKNRELLFPCMAVLQTYVNGFATKMQNSDASGGAVEWRLQYDTDLPKIDWDFFQSIGLKVVQDPQDLDGPPSSIIDFNENTINSFAHSGKHVGQVCGFLSGVAASPLPDIRRVMPRTIKPGNWVLVSDPEVLGLDYSFPACGDLRQYKDDQLSGVIGLASEYTYHAAAMGVAVIEVIPPDRTRHWMSKFTNRGYRLLQTEDTEQRGVCIREAIRAIEADYGIGRMLTTGPGGKLVTER